MLSTLADITSVPEIWQVVSSFMQSTKYCAQVAFTRKEIYEALCPSLKVQNFDSEVPAVNL